MDLKEAENVLEVAAGTCAFGKMLAPHVGKITELDATDAMLAIGRKENEKADIHNAEYVIGSAERLPFEAGAFDIVVSRLAFHHFTSADIAFREMRRVLKNCGKIVIADMLARNEPYRETADKYERLRDPSHARCLSGDEFLSFADKYGLTVLHRSVSDIEMDLEEWLALTNPSENVKKEIINAFINELNGGEKTGFGAYSEKGRIKFKHRWGLFIMG